ncbi:hypothetical protein ABAC460_06215 [Asticcacaulis sp. AC460]|uniref:hypothetical protein n=1 Tax=Asticcacaulis sp. AC460 TaxID=1282360 RepID=UPI0003C40952|nr:hypothetical protein [Asticcacaulis sp. AC460]ESQ91578.1 hypothetical protein ABAC460_06215 [Asticcacaulis sp. AC460]
MSVIMRLLDLLSASHKLKDSKPYVMRALAGMAIFVTLSVFAALMTALLIASLMWLIYAEMLAAGVGSAIAGTLVAGLSLITIGLTAFAALRTWAAVRADIDLVFNAQTPMVGKVADSVTSVAGAFINGLRRRQPEKA